MSIENAIPLASVSSLAKPQRPKSKSLQPCRCPTEGCGKMFSKRSNLKAHMRVHSGVLPYPCNFPGCTKRFRWKSSLKPHIKVHLASGDTLKSSPCSSANFGARAAKEELTLQRYEESSPTTTDHGNNNPVTPSGKAIFRGALLNIPGSTFLLEAEQETDYSPVAITDSSFFESSAAMGRIPHSRQYHCIFSGCGEKFPRMSHLLEHENNAGHQGTRPQVARMLFQDSHSQQEEIKEDEIDLSCESVLSESQASTDVESLTLDSNVEPASNLFDGMPVTEDLWKPDLNVMDPFLDLSMNFDTGSKMLDMLSAEECSAGISATNAQVAVGLPDTQWILPPAASTASTADFASSLYIQ